MIWYGLLVVLLALVTDPSAADRETMERHIAAGLALKDSKRWDDSIGEFRKVLAMRNGADSATWAEATDGMNALCHGQFRRPPAISGLPNLVSSGYECSHKETRLLPACVCMCMYVAV